MTILPKQKSCLLYFPIGKCKARLGKLLGRVCIKNNLTQGQIPNSGGLSPLLSCVTAYHDITITLLFLGYFVLLEKVHKRKQVHIGLSRGRKKFRVNILIFRYSVQMHCALALLSKCPNKLIAVLSPCEFLSPSFFMSKYVCRHS